MSVEVNVRVIVGETFGTGELGDGEGDAIKGTQADMQHKGSRLDNRFTTCLPRRNEARFPGSRIA